MTDVPPGWYDDPEYPTHYRYWDGTRWSEHRSPKAAGSGDNGAWNTVPEAFRLLGRCWRELIVLVAPFLLITIAAGVIALVALDGAIDPGIDTIVDRVTAPGFDPVNDPADEAFIESIEFSMTASVFAGLATAAILYVLATLGSAVASTILLAARHRDGVLTPGRTLSIALRRLPRIVGIGVLWGLAAFGAVFAVALISAVLIVITPLMLLLIVPAVVVAIIYGWPYMTLAGVALMVGPADDPPFRRTIAMVRPRWGAVAVRVLVLTLVFALIGFAANLTTSPFASASLRAGFIATMLVSSLQSVLATAGNVVVHSYAGGPVDPAIASVDQTS